MRVHRVGWLACVAGSLAAIVLSACVERKEQLKISPSGAVEWHVVHTTDSLDELYSGDAVPRLAGGWMVEQQERVEPAPSAQRADPADDGSDEVKTTYTLIADAVFPPDAELPANYGLATEADADLFLQFPTCVTIEDRPDGTYYHFARTYPARSWAQIDLLREGLVEHPTRDFREQDHRTWTPQQRLTMVQAHANFEVEKALVFARAAFLVVTPEDKRPQDAWLAARRYVRECLAAMSVAELAKLLEPAESLVEQQKRDEAVSAEVQRFEDTLRENLKEALRSGAGYNGTQLQNFFVEYDRQKRAFSITEDLGDDQFEIEVRMPGEIVESNADGAAGGTASWSLNGQMFRDRYVELLATSRVAK